LLAIIIKGSGKELRLDVTHARGGVNWKTEFERWITESGDFILFWSKNARKSRWVKHEIEFAQDLERKEGRKEFIKIYRWQPIKLPKSLEDIQVTYVPLREERQPDGSRILICDFKPRLQFVAELSKRQIAALLILILTLTSLAFYGIRALQKWAFNSEIPRSSRKLSTSFEVGNLKWPTTSEVQSSSKPIQSDTQPIPVAVSISPVSSILPPSINKPVITMNDVVDFSWPQSGNVLLTESSSGEIQLWNVETGRSIGSLPIEVKSLFEDERLSHWPERGTHFSTVGKSRQVQLWNGETGQEILLQSISGQPVSGDYARWSPSGRLFLTESKNGKLQLWNGETGQEIAVLPESKYVSWSPNGNILLTISSDNKLQLWNGETGQEIAVLSVKVDWLVTKYQWSPNGRLCLTESKNGKLQLWNGETGREIAALPVKVDLFVTHYQWSPNGKVLLTRSSSRQIQLWNGETGTKIMTLPVEFSPRGYSWSPNGKVLAIQDERTRHLRIYNLSKKVR
jgi:WD40 repeat protein